MARTVFDVLIIKLEEHRSSAIDVLSMGNVDDYAKYRELCGSIRGLELALREIRDLAQTYLDDDDE